MTEDPILLVVGHTPTSHEWTSIKQIREIRDECNDFMEQRFSAVS
jgi:hypothetical protein